MSLNDPGEAWSEEHICTDCGKALDALNEDGLCEDCEFEASVRNGDFLMDQSKENP
jgi:predicted amidophosphoribosyltransferase